MGQGVDRSLLLHFARNGTAVPLVLERGDGPYVVDASGRRCIDVLGAPLGAAYGGRVGAAAARQLERLAVATTGGVTSPPALELAARLASLTGLARVFFTSGGSEAVEAAWKIVRQVHLARGEHQRTTAIARRSAFHGATLGALALTGVAAMKEPFGPPAIEVVHAATTNAYRPEVADPLADVERAVGEAGPENVAMIIAEPVQHAGGCLVPPEGYWAGLRELCDRIGALLVADEVVTGCGRLGEWLGGTRYGAAPDLVTFGSGVTAAYAPMGGVLVRGEVAAPLFDAGRTLLHGVTAGGHPMCAAVALEVLDIYEEDRVFEKVRALEGHLESRLRGLLDLPLVGDVRGAGFLWALELVADADGSRFGAAERERLLRGYLPERLLEAGLIARADDRGDSVLQIAPPLITDRALLDTIADRLGEVLTDAGAWIATHRTPREAEAA